MLSRGDGFCICSCRLRKHRRSYNRNCSRRAGSTVLDAYCSSCRNGDEVCRHICRMSCFGSYNCTFRTLGQWSRGSCTYNESVLASSSWKLGSVYSIMCIDTVWLFLPHHILQLHGKMLDQPCGKHKGQIHTKMYMDSVYHHRFVQFTWFCMGSCRYMQRPYNHTEPYCPCNYG